MDRTPMILEIAVSKEELQEETLQVGTKTLNLYDILILIHA